MHRIPSLPGRTDGAVPTKGVAKWRSGTRPPGQASSKRDAASGRGKDVAVQERRERLAGRAPVQALERTVVEYAVDPPHLLVEDGVERTALGQDLAHDAVAVLVRPALQPPPRPSATSASRWGNPAPGATPLCPCRARGTSTCPTAEMRLVAYGLPSGVVGEKALWRNAAPGHKMFIAAESDFSGGKLKRNRGRINLTNWI